MASNRPLITLVVGISLFAVSSVVSVWSADLSPGDQHELVIQMTGPAESCALYVPVHPETDLVPIGAPPILEAGVIPNVEPRCNSPGYSIT